VEGIPMFFFPSPIFEALEKVLPISEKEVSTQHNFCEGLTPKEHGS
jgi:hypothetical protein